MLAPVAEKEDGTPQIQTQIILPEPDKRKTLVSLFRVCLFVFLIRTIFEMTVLLSELLSRYFFPQKNLSFP